MREMTDSARSSTSDPLPTDSVLLPFFPAIGATVTSVSPREDPANDSLTHVASVNYPAWIVKGNRQNLGENAVTIHEIIYFQLFKS